MVRIGTWNLENRFRPGGQAGPDNARHYAAKLDALAATITKLAPDAGGLNDEAAAASTQLLLALPARRSVTAGFDRPDTGDGQPLWDLAPLLPEEQRYTRIFRGERQLIDHLLVSHAIVQVVSDGDVTTGDVDVPSITEDPNRRRNDPGSDHRPVLAQFEL